MRGTTDLRLATSHKVLRRRSSRVRRCRWSGRGRRGDENSALKSEAAAASTYAYLVKGCSGGLVLDTIEQAFQATR